MQRNQQESELQLRVESLQRRLTELEAHQEFLRYTVSHDLRTPVMTILGFTDMLLGDIDNGAAAPPGAQQYLQRIRQAAQRQVGILERLLDVVRLQRHELQRMPVQLDSLAERCLAELLTAHASPPMVKINPAPPLHCDLELMGVALRELFANAVKFTRNAVTPCIVFGVEREPSAWRFHVRDNGIGFDAANAKRLFKVGQRFHAQHGFEGNGMGLVMAAVIIERHGGRIWVDSRPGQGATTYFTLPA